MKKEPHTGHIHVTTLRHSRACIDPVCRGPTTTQSHLLGSNMESSDWTDSQPLARIDVLERRAVLAAHRLELGLKSGNVELHLQRLKRESGRKTHR